MKKVYVVKKRRLFDCQSTKPFPVSRSQIDAYCDCPRCFFLNHRLGIRQPSFAPYTLNMKVDTVLKAEFDLYRAKRKPHPIMLANGIDAIPFADERLDDWRNNFKGMQSLHKPTNLLITGAPDDIWQNTRTGTLIVVDYKATATDKPITLDDEWKIAYKRQMEVYIWLLRRQGLKVEDRGFFLYCNGQTAERFDGALRFTTELLPYQGNSDWIEPLLPRIKACLTGKTMPPPTDDCEHCGYIAALTELTV